MIDYQTQLLSFSIALLTTLVTVAFTKYYESKSMSKQHANELRKIFLDKKISASESIIASLAITSTTFYHLQLLFTGLKNDTIDSITESVNESLNNTIALELKKIQDLPQICY